MTTLHLRATILNPGLDISPLKFRGWLRAEAANIDMLTRQSGQPHQVSIIWLYLPEQLRLLIGQGKLDKIIQGIVDKFETIYRIELRRTQSTLTADEMMQAQEELHVYMEALRPGPGGKFSPTGVDNPSLH